MASSLIVIEQERKDVVYCLVYDFKGALRSHFAGEYPIYAGNYCDDF